MMHLRLPLLLSMLLLTMATGCDSSEPEPEPTILVAGNYTGTANVDGTAVTLTLTLAETNNAVTGSGTLRISGPVSLTATGTHVGNDFNLTLSSSGFEDINFAGTVQSSGSVLSGRLNGSGFDNVAITMNRT